MMIAIHLQRKTKFFIKIVQSREKQLTLIHDSVFEFIIPNMILDRVSIDVLIF